jgi:hypothetical protein
MAGIPGASAPSSVPFTVLVYGQGGATGSYTLAQDS